MTDRQADIMNEIYNKINSMIGAGNQLFSMQFPAQPLNHRMYEYDTNDRNSVLTRPYTVAEQEFRLSDQLFDISPITAGSNGEKLSVVYKTIINNFIPQLKHLAPFIRDRAGLGLFLLEDSGEKDGAGKPISRIELCKKLYKEYLEEKNKWNEEKNQKFDESKEENDLDGYAKWQSSYAMVRQEELNNLYNDVVVRGHLHEVLTILGYLNASSIAEELELAKQNMRHSSRASLDESMTVYPVQMQPNNWFKALSPNLNPEDLTMAKESIRDQFIAKQRELSRAKAELQQMELLSADPAEITRVEGEVKAAKNTLDVAESEIITKYGEGVVGMAKIYFDVTKDENGNTGEFSHAKAKELGATDNSEKYLNAIKGAVAGISETYTAQQNLTNSIANLTSLKAKRAGLDSRDWKFNKASLEQRINELETDVDFYGSLLANVHKESAKTTRIDLRRISHVNETLTYEIGVARTLTGGTFQLVIGAKTTNNIPVTLVVVADKANIDYGALKDKILSETIAIAPNATIEDVPNSPGHWKISIQNLVEEVDIRANEEALQPLISMQEMPILSTPQTEEEAEISGMFQDILLKISDSEERGETLLEEEAQSSSWGVSTWFGSASGQSSSSSAKSAQSSSFFNQEIEIGFRVAKVSFDRGGWFNPQVFKMSHAFYRLADLRVSPGLNIEDVKKNSQSQTELQALTQYQGDIDSNGQTELTNYILPAFPVAMAIAKDITIKVKITKTNSASAKSVVESSSAAGGGFLCFSASSASSSKNSSESVFHGSHGEYYYIRIPGPQVIGYFLQFVPKDNSTPYEPTFTDKGDSPVIKALQLYDQAHALLGSSDNLLLNPDNPTFTTIDEVVGNG
jgi:hypothetical protein